MRAIPYGLPAAPHNAKHPSGRVTCRYMSGRGLVVAHSRVYTWQGREPIQGGAPAGRGSPGRWGCGLRAIPYGLPAAPHNANHPGGRVTYRYMSGHGLVVAPSRVHAWRGREPILAGWGTWKRLPCWAVRLQTTLSHPGMSCHHSKHKCMTPCHSHLTYGGTVARVMALSRCCPEAQEARALPVLQLRTPVTASMHPSADYHHITTTHVSICGMLAMTVVIVGGGWEAIR